MSVEMTRGETVDARALQLQDTMIKLVRAFDLHQPERTPCGEPVPVSEAHALMELSRRQALAQHELGARLRLQRSTVSRLVRQLESRGWVSRDRHASDGRVAVLSLTASGQAGVDQLSAARSAKFARVLEAIPESDRTLVQAGLSLLVDAASRG